MAKKKTGAKMPAIEEELKVVRLALPPDAHQDFRVLAATEGTNMAILARRIILDWIERRKKEGRK